MNSVITTAFGYQAEILVPFVRSLRKVYGDHIVFFVRSSYSREIYDLARNYDVELVAVEDSWYSAPEVDRYFVCQNYLRKNARFDNIFWTDSRDVVFQASPFPVENLSHLYVYAEPVEIRDCGINGGWIRHYYGDDVLADIAMFPVLCSGTTLGAYEQMKQYIDLMCLEIDSKLGDNSNYVKGADQGFHNFLFHSGRMPWATVRKHGFSEVQTLHHERRFTFSRDCFLLNFDGRAVPVVHQYDRFPQFFPLLEKMLNR